MSKLERVLRASSFSDATWTLRENIGISHFKHFARLYERNLPEDEDLLGWLSYMQHYGAPTRLTDWTLSPFVACYFAYEQQLDAETSDAALWMLNASGCRARFGALFPFGRDHTGGVPVARSNKEGLAERVDSPNRELAIKDVRDAENDLLRFTIKEELNWPLPLPILEPDARMAAQQACFVASGDLHLMTPNIIEFLMEPGGLAEARKGPRYEKVRFYDAWMRYYIESNQPEDFVRKIRLPLMWRKEALESLAFMNISGSTLFPGLDGLGRSTLHAVSISTYPTMGSYFGL